MCIGLVGRKHSVLKTVLECLKLRGNLYVLLHGMGCVSRVAWNKKQPLWLRLTVVLRTALYRQHWWQSLSYQCSQGAVWM